MLKKLTALASSSLALAAIGCAQPSLLKDTVDLSPVVKARDLRGLSVNGANVDVLVERMGIVTVARDGSLISQRTPGENGLWDVEYKDVASVDAEVFVLLADQEGYLYDARNQTQRVHFCVEPGFEPGPDPTEPVITQVNDAVAASGNIIVAAPRFYENDELVSTELRTYLAGDGAPIESVDLTSLGLELRGLALHGEEVLAVQDNQLHRFSLEGELLASKELDGLEGASGVTVRNDELLVTDENAAAIRVYSLEDVTRE